MGEVMKKEAGGMLAAANALKANLQTVQTQMPEVSGSQYLRMLTDGNWVFGAENVEVTDKWELAINPMSIKTGWTCWENNGDGQKNDNLGEIMVPLGQPAPIKSSLPDQPFPWKEQISMELTVLDGDRKYKGKTLEYKTSSMGGLRIVRAIIDQVMLQLDEDPEHIVPIVALSSDHYQHKAYGRTYTPEINIEEFVSMDDVNDVAEPEAEKEEKPKAEKPKAKSRRKEEPEVVEDEVEEAEVVEEETAEEEPRRRRRRR